MFVEIEFIGRDIVQDRMLRLPDRLLQIKNLICIADLNRKDRAAPNDVGMEFWFLR
jgi:hypothetical protein